VRFTLTKQLFHVHNAGMNRKQLVESINQEIEKLQSAVNLLVEDKPVKTYTATKTGGRTYIMNPAARKRIADAQKARWEKIRAAKLDEVRKQDAAYKAKAKPTKADSSRKSK
jgi:predicted transcriptional regulator